MTAASGSSRLPILVIEDEPSVLSFVKTALERTGYPVTPANCGADALKLLEAGKLYRDRFRHAHSRWDRRLGRTRPGLQRTDQKWSHA